MNIKRGRGISIIFHILFAAIMTNAVNGSFAYAQTLPELNQSTSVTRTYKFLTGENVTLTENMGITSSGTFSILGKNKDSNSILFDNYSGFVLSRIQTSLRISDVTITGALSNIGSVIYNTASDSSVILSNINIESNSVSTTGNARGGAIFSNSELTLNNVSFKGNSAVTSGSTTDAKGGAIYSRNSVSMIADSDNVVIVDNYTQDSTGQTDNAIYIDNNSATLTLKTQNDGVIELHDSVDGASGYNVNITTDGTGKVGLYNSIKNGNINVQNANITMVDDKTNNHQLDNLNIGNDVTFSIDANMEDETADTITSENGSGTVYLSDLHIISTPSSNETKLQVLKNAGNLVLNIDKLQSKLYTNVAATMYNSSILADSLALGTTDITNDSIVITNLKDVLYEMVKDDNPLHMIKNFIFDTDSEYNLTKDLEHTPQESLLTIYNISDSEYGVINANDHSMFKMDNPITNVTLDGIKIKNAKTDGDGSVANITDNSASINVNNSVLTDNTSTGKGGAIYVKNGTVSFDNSKVENNTAGSDGGAVYVDDEARFESVNTDFKNNTSSGKGGAIYTKSDLNITADNGSSTFEGNTASGENNAIYAESGANVNLTAQNKGTINMNDKISGSEDGYNLNISGSSNSNVNINNSVENANITLNGTNLNLGQDDLLKGNGFNAKGGTINMINNDVGNTDFSTLTTSGKTKVKVDVDLANKKMDRITADHYSSIKGTVNVSKMHLLSDAKSTKTKVYFADSPLRRHVTSSVKIVSYSRVYRYLVTYNPSDGYFTFNRGTGYDDMSFNPAVLAGPVAQQTAYMNELQNYQSAMYHSDTYMMLPKHVRLSMYRNSYADAELENNPSVVSHIAIPEEVKSIWVRPYVSFESIPLHRGPKVSSINYGTLAGGESDMINLGHGFSLVYGGYIGYNGNSYHYTDVDATQQGAVLGATAYLYKGNFFNTLTANVGWMINNSDTIYGSDTMNIIMSGFADKAGYNFEINNGKVIIQPSLMMGYTFVYSTDYTTSNNVRIDADPLHVVHFIPGLKIIGNLSNGWQPYAVVNIVCSFADKTNFTADNIQLPKMSVNPYVEYGIGLQKRWADKYSGFAQATVRGGGRRGAALLFGFRYMMGKLANTVFTPHEDAKPKRVIFKPKRNLTPIVEKTNSEKTKLSKHTKRPKDRISKESKTNKKRFKISNLFRKMKKKMTYQYNTDVSAKVVTEDVYNDGVIMSNINGMRSKIKGGSDYQDVDRIKPSTGNERPSYKQSAPVQQAKPQSVNKPAPVQQVKPQSVNKPAPVQQVKPQSVNKPAPVQQVKPQSVNKPAPVQQVKPQSVNKPAPVQQVKPQSVNKPAPVQQVKPQSVNKPAPVQQVKPQSVNKPAPVQQAKPQTVNKPVEQSDKIQNKDKEETVPVNNPIQHKTNSIQRINNQIEGIQNINQNTVKENKLPKTYSDYNVEVIEFKF